jgi:hypothetical protein
MPELRKLFRLYQMILRLFCDWCDARFDDEENSDDIFATKNINKHLNDHNMYEKFSDSVRTIDNEMDKIGETISVEGVVRVEYLNQGQVCPVYSVGSVVLPEFPDLYSRIRGAMSAKPIAYIKTISKKDIGNRNCNSERKIIAGVFRKELEKLESNINIMRTQGMDDKDNERYKCRITGPFGNLPDIITWRLSPEEDLTLWKDVESMITSSTNGGGAREMALGKIKRKRALDEDLQPKGKYRGVLHNPT